MTVHFNVSGDSPAVIFVNPNAGRGKAQRCLHEIKSLFAARAVPIEFFLTRNTDEMTSRVCSALSAGRRVLLAMGGDGTLQCLVNAARNSDVVLGILPTGGGNDVAAALGLPTNPVSAAEVILSGQTRLVDLLRARTADGRERLYVGGGGIGLDADAAKYTSSYARVPGRLRYVLAALHALREFHPLRVCAEFPHSSVSTMNAEVMLAAALNTPTYGAGLRLAPEARIDDGLLTALFVKKLSALEVLAAVPRLLAHGNLPDSFMTRVNASRLRLSADRACLFHGDGEIFGPAPVEIQVLPKAVRMLAPVAPLT